MKIPNFLYNAIQYVSFVRVTKDSLSATLIQNIEKMGNLPLPTLLRCNPSVIILAVLSIYQYYHANILNSDVRKKKKKKIGYLRRKQLIVKQIDRSRPY